jgi:D-arginine dehydrogenase
MTDFDVAIIGGGIAGAGLASELAGHLRVLLLEAEAQSGYHATGRSVAFWTESYGGSEVQPLTTASGSFLRTPPPDFADRPLMIKRGALHIGTVKDEQFSKSLLADFATSAVAIDPIDFAEIKKRVPSIRDEWTIGLYEPECCDIDVAALLAAYLRHAKRQGATCRYNSFVKAVKFSAGKWSIETGQGQYTARRIVNAAGAWADQVALISGVDPIGIKPFRRTVVQLATEPTFLPDTPLVIGLDGNFYFKPDLQGRIWLSPHDEAPATACDAAPEEYDVALAIDRFQQVVDCGTLTVEHKWAGLRSFAPDRCPVIGYDPAIPEFFWLAGQGGFGIQTAPAVSKLAASLICSQIRAPEGITAGKYGPGRFR